jgi:ribosomal protein S18 acetylase RimI-like enzyme
MPFVRINLSNSYLVERFVQRAGTSLITFRYFETRPFSVVQRHACTWVIIEGEQVEAYGHLDRESGTVWLGVAVADHARGRGIGRKMMQRLMDSAISLGIPAIRLSVDNGNETAIRLYERFGFRQIAKGERSSFYEWRSEFPR